ncbi:acetyl-CoA hydrolase/transferase C-terminal domain-containing protein [Rhodococcus ruber]|uniref:acetyl-CoA hydrolase/transferase C-terminal domain-containing protein n=1 Tax=Rhodococcus ruber TaxID=1830 RepID=UPI000E6B4374|nr:acetyl-CoA hydrolase/transferase C-terminal domain-containing protein [Rhodococcus ruber]AXY49278.1 hypothetical protein YT1_p10077 [Rhodococcus ruber]
MSASFAGAADTDIRTVLCAEGLYEPNEGILRYLDLFPATAADPVRVLFGVRRTPVPDRLIDDPHVHLATFIPGRGLRRATVDYLRFSYREICRRISDRSLRLHGVVACTGRSGEHGHRSLGVVNGYLQLALDTAEVVVVEEWPDMAAIPGAAVVRHVEHVVPWDGPDNFTALSGAADNAATTMAEYVSGLIPPQATLALGVGKIADAIAEQCSSRSGLSITTGAITESVMRLDRAGALDPTAAIDGMSIIGDRELVSWAAAHPRVHLQPSTRIHEPTWLARRDRFVTVLGALSVDLEGNINSEVVGGRMVSGIGGAPDFARAAHLSSEGLCIVTLPSRDRFGSTTLCDRLSDRASIEGRFVDAVVTERGVAVRSNSGEASWRRSLQRIFE